MSNVILHEGNEKIGSVNRAKEQMVSRNVPGQQANCSPAPRPFSAFSNPGLMEIA